MTRNKRILFICMGNICRSAAAEAVLKKAVEDKGLENEYFIDSAGIIGYHAGERADRRMIEAAYARGYRITSVSRQVRPEDFEKFDRIIAMDDSNVRGLKEVARQAASIYGHGRSSAYDFYISKISKLTDFCTPGFLQANGMPTEVPDPYYGGAAGFQQVLDMLENSVISIIEKTK